MCIIVDANMLGKFLAEPPDEDSKPIKDWLQRKSGRLIYSTGGKFSNEVKGRAREQLLTYYRSGLADRFLSSDFKDDEEELRENIKSDDPHILALARASGARILYSSDKDLIEDFKDKRFVDQPRGKVYSGARNARLLTRSACRKQNS